MNKRLVFTITTGRSGTMYLSDLLRVSGVKSFHEPTPNFVSIMRNVQRDYKLALDFWRYYKLPVIRAIKSDTYFEASHLFCKGFVEPLIELGHIPDVVILKRDNREVALSLLRIKTVPDITQLGLRWLLSTKDPNVCKLRNKAALNQKNKNWTPYQLCYWYTLETDRRADYYRRYLSACGSSILDINSKDLYSGQAFQDLSKFFNVEIKTEKKASLNQNKKETHPDLELSDSKLEILEEEVRNHIITW